MHITIKRTTQALCLIFLNKYACVSCGVCIASVASVAYFFVFVVRIFQLDSSIDEQLLTIYDGSRVKTIFDE
jgi:hypothetical protein